MIVATPSASDSADADCKRTLRVFVTGATGFIGRYVVERLSAAGHEAVCLVRRHDRTDTPWLQGDQTRVVPGDLLDRATLVQGMASCDTVIHLASTYSFWERDRSVYWRVNVEGTRNVLEAAVETRVRRLVHVSSMLTYGRPTRIPFDEDDAPGALTSEYARSKAAGDEVARELARRHGLALVVVAPAAVLGAGDRKASGQYIANLVDRRLPARAAERGRVTFVHVRDVAEAIVRAAEQPESVGQTYLVGHEVLTIGELNRLVADIAGVPLPAVVLPDPLAFLAARLLTSVADLMGRPPLWGFALDQVRTMLNSGQADGGRAERELGLHYTPIRAAVEEVVAELRSPACAGARV